MPNYGVPSKRFDGRCNNVVTSLNIEVAYASIGIITIIIEIIIILSLLSKVCRKFRLHNYVCLYCVIFILHYRKFLENCQKLSKVCQKIIENSSCIVMSAFTVSFSYFYCRNFLENCQKLSKIVESLSKN